ncbi:putative oxidoreductase, partial [Lachnellula suecica]
NTPPKMTALSSTIKLNNGTLMPKLHLGVYMTSGSSCANAVSSALHAGYHAVDSAEWYGNEAEVGSAINSFLNRNGGVKREDIWFTTKLKTNSGYDETRRKIRDSIRKSGLGYIDLYLLHSPYGGRSKRAQCWQAVVDAVAEGQVRAGGVSNFGVRHLEQLLEDKPGLLPQVNQIELHPFNTQPSIVSFCESHNITLEAYAPLARSMRATHPTITQLAKKYGVSWAQLLVRWSLQRGFVPLPKSVKETRIRQNADVDGWVIDEADMEVLGGLDEQLVTDWDPTDAD